MDVTDILEPLNDAQREAVTAPAGHMLVLAGAGSGKTRVLVHRIAWLLATREATPFGILAVTFTNKAASEMRSRIESMLGRPAGGMWVGTFHGLAHRLLRVHWQDAGLREDFQILDSEDQLRCIRRVLRDLDLDEQRWPPKQAQGYINARKDEGLRAEHIEPRDDIWMTRMLRIYAAYQETCERTGVVDFAELLLRCHELLRDRADVLAHYRQRFRHILVDEFQDTNTIQYAWLRLLAGSEGHLCCVGDDDQSVYGWRGARIENILQFPRDFADVETVRLERNYRSTGNILAAANALIANNQGRMGKNLWTEDGDGEPIEVYAGFNDLDEARFIVSRIGQWVETGGRRDEVAILYRVSAQSRVLEEALITQGVAYRVFGGLRFYERAEIKNALAYCRLVANRDDDAAFERIVNLPPRGIGVRTVDTLRTEAKGRGESLWAAATRVVADGTLGARAAGALGRFLALVGDLAAGFRDIALDAQIEIGGPGQRTVRLLPAGEGRPRPDAHREPAGAPDRGEPVRPRRRGSRFRRPADRIPRPCRAGGGRGAGGRRRGRGQPDDPALGEGAGVPRGVPVRDGGRALSAQPQQPGCREARGGAAAVLRGDDPGEAQALHVVRGVAAPLRGLGPVPDAVALP